MKRIYAITLMVMLMPMMVLAQFRISGKVLDESTKRPLAGASVQLDKKHRQTDVGGLFSFENVSTGTYTIKVTFVGYGTYNGSVTLNENKNLTIELSRSSILTDEVIVKGTRAGSKTPTTYRNVGREELQKNNLGQDLPYLLNQTPSVVVSSDAGTGIGYTGIRIRGSDPTRVNVTINGIPYNDPESQGTFWVNLPDFASSVDNIQIQRGVGTSTNGAGAFGGSLNIQTTTRRDSAYVELNNSIGSFSTVKNTLSFGSGLIRQKFTMDARLSRIESKGYIDRGSSDLQSYFLSGAYYGKNDLLRFNVFAGKEKTFQVWNGVPESKLRGDTAALKKHYYNNLGYLYYTREDSLNLWNANKRTYSQFLYDDQTDNYRQNHYQFLYNKNFSSSLTLSSALHYTYGRGYYEELKNNSVLEDYGVNPATYGGKADTVVNLVRQRWLSNHFYGLTSALSFSPSSIFSVTFGGAYNEYDGDHFGDVISTNLPQPKVNQRYYSGVGFKKDLTLYAKTDFEVGKARIYYDFQYRYLDYSITGTDKNRNALNQHHYLEFFNPKVGVTYQPIENLNLYTSFAIGNKEPNRDDYVNAIQGDLPKPENLKNVEAGGRFSERNIQAGINLYGMFYRNQLIPTGKINDVGEYIRQNVGESHRIGLELDARLRPVRSLIWGLTASISQNKVKDYTEFMDDWDNGGQVSVTYKNTNTAYSPSFIASNEISYQVIKNGEVGLLSKYVGKQFLDNTSNNARKLDAFFVNDLRLRYNLSYKALKNLGFTLLVNNLFNEMYESNGYSYSFLYGDVVTENFYFPQAGRNFMLGVNLKF